MNVLGIGAHYDDLELGCSGTLIKHVQNGDKVTMLVVTDSAYSNPDGDVVRNKNEAEREGRAAASIVGAELICLDYRTFEVPFDERLTRTILEHIERLDVDTVYGPWLYDVHRDHQYTARCTLMASRHVPRLLMYRSNYYDSNELFHGSFYSDISETMETKLQVIEAHKSELERVRYKWIEFFKNQNANDGQKIGIDYAECFEVVRYLV